MHEAERSLFDLRRGRTLHVTNGSGQAADDAILMAPVEGLTPRALEQLRGSDRPLRLAVTHHRAHAMGLTSAPASGPVPDRSTGRNTGDVSLGLNGETSPDQILRLSSGLGRHASDAFDLRAASASEIGGLTLARLGQLLPAVVSVPLDRAGADALDRPLANGAILSVSTEQIAALAGNVRVEVTHVSDGPVPLEEAEDARFVCFREANGILEHVAILIGVREHWPDPVPVRLHSACLTGDLFGSLRCDCGQQLRGSLRVFAARGGGVLLYLAQEGRSIGLGNKLRAYALQQEGLDTVDADCTLGFGADERRYDAAVAMLRLLQLERIQLLTNNPEKVRALEAGGIDVVDRQPLYGTLNRHNLPYVKAKVHRAGHWLAEMLTGPIRAD
ncbi:MAG: GTP cyclohydrolase II RibA [Vicinamibacterales bacterium]|jgi:GTP cyclohydrolase II|nr:GTP cyclohydrolase II RibA [Vicinamibacterales bacterium]